MQKENISTFLKPRYALSHRVTGTDPANQLSHSVAQATMKDLIRKKILAKKKALEDKTSFLQSNRGPETSTPGLSEAKTLLRSDPLPVQAEPKPSRLDPVPNSSPSAQPVEKCTPKPIRTSLDRITLKETVNCALQTPKSPGCIEKVGSREPDISETKPKVPSRRSQSCAVKGNYAGCPPAQALDPSKDSETQKTAKEEQKPPNTSDLRRLYAKIGTLDHSNLRLFSLRAAGAAEDRGIQPTMPKAASQRSQSCLPKDSSGVCATARALDPSKDSGTLKKAAEKLKRLSSSDYTRLSAKISSLDLSNPRLFALRAVAEDRVIQCTIVRDKSGLINKFYPIFHLYFSVL